MNRLLSIALVCLLHVSLAVASTFNLSVEVTPRGSGSLNTSGGTYEEGSSVYLRTYGNTGYVFQGWYEGETLLSSSSNFNYTMPSKDVTVQARYEFDPTVPDNPAMPDTTTYYSFTAQVSPVGAGSLNTYSGKYAAGASVYMRTYGNTGYQFVGWQNNVGETVSTSSSFNYTMPRNDANLTALYVYDPSVPANPDSMATRYTVTIACKPVGGGTFNTTSATAEEGGNVHLYAYTNTGYRFLRWENEGGETVSTAQNFYYVIPHGNSKLNGVFEYDPVAPGNPNKNYWNKELGEVIVDDFTTGYLGNAVSEAISGSSRDDVAMITVAGRMNDNDFGIANNYTNCTLFDLSRVTGITVVPSYAFDYTNLETVYLPASIEKIAYGAFYECKQLSALVVYAMTPPTLENQVFTNVPEGLIVYVPASAIAQYQEAAGWKDFTILPIQEDIRSISVSLPEGANATDYAQMWLELTNTKSGQRMHYVMTDRQIYTFANIIRNTSWNVTLRNERGDVFGQIDNVDVKEEDVSVTFASLSKPQSVTISVLTPDGQDVTAQTQVTWTDAQGNYLAQGVSLTGLPTGYQTAYRIVLSQELAMAYNTPQPVDYVLIDGDNRITCQLNAIPQVKITGKVKDVSTGLPLSGAVISASQTFGGKYSKTLNAKTDANGVFTLDIANVPTSVAFAASDYVSQTLDFTDHELLELNELEDVLLKSITGATISLGFTYTSCDGETQNWYSDYQNVNYELFNVTKNKTISQYNVQYPQIVLLEEVADGDVLRLIATSRTNAFMSVTATATIAEQKAETTFAIVELGKIQSSFTSTGNAAVVGSLYDAAGKLLKTYNYSEASLTINDLTDGNYTLVSMGSSRLFNTIYDLAQLPQTGLLEGSDYVQNSVEVKSGQVSAISISEVPTLDESKLYYTGDNTSFTVNKPSIVAGNYLTLTGRIDFKPAYATSVSNVQMIVDLPESCEFVENSVMVGNSTSSYTINGNQITIPMVRYTDRVRFCIIPTLGGEYAPSAFVQFDLNGETVTQPIGSANYTAKDLTISVPSTVAKTGVPMSGTAIGACDIEIYDSDVLIGQTRSLANGTWATTCELNEPYNLSKHSIYAKVTTKNGLELQSETKDIIYDMNAIQISKVTMFHWNPEMNTMFESVFDFQNPSTKANQWTVYYPKKVFTYTVEFTNNSPEKVFNVVLYVHTANGKIVPLYPTYDEAKDIWVTDIDMGNHNDGYYPVNVSVNYEVVSDVVVDKKQLEENKSELQFLLDEYNTQILLLIEAMKDETGAKIDSLADELSISFDDVEFADALAQLRDSLDNMTEEEFEAYGKELEKEISDFLDCNQSFVENTLTIMDCDSTFVITNEDGSFMEITDAKKYIGKDLIGEGYIVMPLTNGDSLYVIQTDTLFVIVDLINDKVISITLPPNSIDNANELRKANSRNVAILIRNAVLGINEAVKSITGFRDDLMNRLLQETNEIEKAGKKINWELGKAQNYLNKSKDPLKKAFWASKITAIKAQQISNSIALGLAKTCRPLIRKVIPIMDYIDMTSKLIRDINTVGDLYLAVPEPCPEDQAEADILSAQTLSLIGIYAGYATGRILLRAQADAKIATGIIASLPSGGTSLLASLWGLIDNVVLGVALDYAYEKTRNWAISKLRTDIAGLKCYKDPCENGDCLDDNNGGSGSGGGGTGSGNPNDDVRIDPSGFVYEGVFSNRVEGAIATVFYKETVEDMYGDLHENIVKWDAEEYAQENPLFTDENGYYRWDVPQGLWQVKFEKDGYETTYSEWLPVPPPQLDVNIAMKQNVQPKVKAARAYEDAVEMEFDKYMMPELLTAENIMVMQNGTAVEGVVELLNEEVSYEGEEETFASKVRFNAAEPFTEQEITLMVNNHVKSYAGIRMQDNYEQTFTIEQEIRQILSDSLVVVGYGEKAVLTVTVLPAAASKGKMLSVKTSSPMILFVETEQIVIDDDGKAEITVSGELPGTAALTFSVEGTDKEGLTIISVEQKANKTVATPTASIASGTEIEKGTAISLACETEGATIYYTLDGSCPCDETGSRKVYDAPIIINETMTIKAMAMVPDMYESDVAEFIYFVNEEVNSLVLDKESIMLKVNETEKLTVTVLPEEAKDKSVTWMSSDEAIAVVDAEGVVEGKKAGTAVITVASVSNPDVTATCEIMVIQPVSDVVLDVTSIHLEELGETYQLTATVLPEDASDKSVTWLSSDDTVCTVSETGLVTAIGVGTAAITVTTVDGEKTATCDVIVFIPVKSITLNADTLKMQIGDTRQLEATILPDNATDKSIEWVSSDESVVMIDVNGVVTAVEEGNAVITVNSHSNPNVMAMCEVTVIEDNGIFVLQVGEMGQIRAIYDVAGRKVESLRKGVNIVVMNDGTIKRVLVK